MACMAKVTTQLVRDYDVIKAPTVKFAPDMLI